MGSQPELLCVGHDPVLNRTRRLLFEPFFAVRVAGNLRDAVTLLSEHRFQLVLLCYSLDTDGCRALVDFVQLLEHRPRVLALEYGGPRCHLAPPDEEFRPSGPASLLHKAAAMAGIQIPENPPAGPAHPPPPKLLKPVE